MFERRFHLKFESTFRVLITLLDQSVHWKQKMSKFLWFAGDRKRKLSFPLRRRPQWKLEGIGVCGGYNCFQFRIYFILFHFFTWQEKIQRKYIYRYLWYNYSYFFMANIYRVSHIFTFSTYGWNTATTTVFRVQKKGFQSDNKNNKISRISVNVLF